MINKQRIKTFIFYMVLSGIVGWNMNTIITNREKDLTDRVRVLENKINFIINSKQEYNKS